MAIGPIITKGYSIGSIALVVLRGYGSGVDPERFVFTVMATGAFTAGGLLSDAFEMGTAAGGGFEPGSTISEGR